MKEYKFVGTLTKDGTDYYFEIAEDAYIEKTPFIGESKAGRFPIEQARKCYKALLNQGYRLVTESLE